MIVNLKVHNYHWGSRPNSPDIPNGHLWNCLENMVFQYLIIHLKTWSARQTCERDRYYRQRMSYRIGTH